MLCGPLSGPQAAVSAPAQRVAAAAAAGAGAEGGAGLVCRTAGLVWALDTAGVQVGLLTVAVVLLVVQAFNPTWSWLSCIGICHLRRVAAKAKSKRAGPSAVLFCCGRQSGSRRSCRVPHGTRNQAPAVAVTGSQRSGGSRRNGTPGVGQIKGQQPGAAPAAEAAAGGDLRRGACANVVGSL